MKYNDNLKIILIYEERRIVSLINEDQGQFDT